MFRSDMRGVVCVWSIHLGTATHKQASYHSLAPTCCHIPPGNWAPRIVWGQGVCVCVSVSESHPISPNGVVAIGTQGKGSQTYQLLKHLYSTTHLLGQPSGLIYSTQSIVLTSGEKALSCDLQGLKLRSFIMHKIHYNVRP